MMVNLSTRQPILKACLATRANANLSSSTHMAGCPISRRSAAVSVPVILQERLLVAVPRASYSNDNYGPVGGGKKMN